MKKSIKVLTLLLLASSASAIATPVSQQRAAQVAQLFVSEQFNAPTGLAVKSAVALNDQLYLINFSPCGWAIVSSDDTAEPIVGYSSTGSLSPNRMPENMSYMMKEASNGVISSQIKAKSNNKWTRIENGSLMKSRGGEPANDGQPLIQVNWNQSSPYNAYCPGNGGSKALVGCVAVAMSQAMSVQKYPVKPSGRASYACAGYGTLTVDYDQEKEYDWDAILKGSNNYNEAARLMYHAGVSVSMEYGTDGSGIPSNQVYRITNALKENFGYGSDVAYYWRDSYTGDWEDLLLNELYAGRAIVYNAIDKKGGYGHSFNIDGYNGSLYHVNWGWGGYGNGNFSIDALKDASMDMNYDSNHVAVIGIGSPNSALRSLGLTDVSVETGLPVGSPFCALLINGELASQTNFVVEAVTGAYSGTVYSQVPFEYKNGLLVTTEELSTSTPSYYVRIVVKDIESGIRLTQGFNVDVEAPQLLEHKTSMSYDRVTKQFTVKTRFGSTYVLKDASGNNKLSGEITTSPYLEFNRSTLTSGTNTLEITSNGESKTIKIKL